MTNSPWWHGQSRRLSGELPFKSSPSKVQAYLRLRLWNSKGFTLLEMILVLAIIAIGASMVAPSITSGVKSAELKATCRKAGALMHRARSNAVAYKQTMVASIDRKTQSLAVQPFTSTQEEPEKQMPHGVSISYPLPRDIHIEEVLIGEEESRDEDVRSVIFFYPDGRSTGGQILFQDNRGRALSLLVDRITGSAEIREPQEGNSR
jgi:general secretion pathway protein H